MISQAFLDVIAKLFIEKDKLAKKGGMPVIVRKSGLGSSLPSIVYVTFRSLNNKLNEPYSHITFTSDYRSAYVHYFAEIWLTFNTLVKPNSFGIIRNNRHYYDSKKRR